MSERCRRCAAARPSRGGALTTSRTGRIAPAPGEVPLERLIAEHPWEATPLGPRDGWDPHLQTAVNTILSSGYPMWIGWGPEMIQLYNDAYRPILGAKHPRALGRTAEATFPEVWSSVGPLLIGVLQRGDAVYFEDLSAPMVRRGWLEDCYFTFSYSPLPGRDRAVGGVLATVIETTSRLVRERQVGTLRDVATGPGRATSGVAVARAVMRVLSRQDWLLDAAAVYLRTDDMLHRTAAHGAWHGSRTLAIKPAGGGRTRATTLDALLEAASSGGRIKVATVEGRTFAALPVSMCRGGPVEALVAFRYPELCAADAQSRPFLEQLIGQVRLALANAAARRRAADLSRLEELDRRVESQTLELARSQERERIAMDLHDGVIQSLYSIALDLASRPRVEGAAREQLIGRLNEAIREVRGYLYGDRREHLEERAPVRRRLERIVAGFRRRAQLTVVAEFDAAAAAAVESMDACHDAVEWVLREALANVQRHARARTVSIRLARQDRRLVLVVQDDGVGFDPDAVRESSTSHGLRNLRRRAEAVGGRLQLASQPGDGTRVILDVPVR